MTDVMPGARWRMSRRKMLMLPSGYTKLDELLPTRPIKDFAGTSRISDGEVLTKMEFNGITDSEALAIFLPSFVLKPEALQTRFGKMRA